eukprot:s2225_g13.t1
MPAPLPAPINQPPEKESGTDLEESQPENPVNDSETAKRKALDDCEVPVTPAKKARVEQPTPVKGPNQLLVSRLRAKTQIIPKLSQEQRDRLVRKKEEVGRGKQGNALRQNFDRKATDTCRFCGARKHERPWEVRETGYGSIRPIGSFCYPCVHACTVLGLGTRSYEVLSQLPDVVALLVEASRQEQQRLDRAGAGHCSCAICVPKEPED